MSQEKSRLEKRRLFNEYRDLLTEFCTLGDMFTEMGHTSDVPHEEQEKQIARFEKDLKKKREELGRTLEDEKRMMDDIWSELGKQGKRR